MNLGTDTMINVIGPRKLRSPNFVLLFKREINLNGNNTPTEEEICLINSAKRQNLTWWTFNYNDNLLLMIMNPYTIICKFIFSKVTTNLHNSKNLKTSLTKIIKQSES